MSHATGSQRGPGLLARIPGLAGTSRTTIVADVVAGATLAAVAIPELMGYTKIAGMPVITGIYTLALPVIVFGLIGSSRHLVVGADSASAAIMFAALTAMGLHDVTPGSPEWVGLAGVIALLAAAYLLVARLLRLGFLADFLSRTALVGFLTGVGIQVALTQLPAMLGIHATGSVEQQLQWVVGHLGQVVVPSVILAVAAVAVIMALGAVAERIPAALLVVAASIALTAAFRLDRHGVAIVGSVSAGFPPLALPQHVTWGDVPGVAGVAASIFVVILAQSAATARSFAQKRGEELDENRDLVGLAVANVAAGFSGTFCVNGSPTKTAVVDAAGGRTQLAQLVMAVLAIAVLLVATGLLRYLPDATLAAVVFVIGVHLVDGHHLRDLWRLRRDELALAVATALVVVLVGVEQGIVLAVALSVLDFVRRAYRPRDTVMVAGPGPAGFLPQPARLGVETLPGGIAYRFDGTLFFANADHFRQRLLALVGAAPHPVAWVVLDLSPVADIDYTAGQVLLTVLRNLRAKSVRVHLAHGEDIHDLLRRYGVIDLVGADHVHHGVRDAVAAAVGGPVGGAPDQV